MQILNKFYIQYAQDNPDGAGWLTGPAELVESTGNITIEHVPIVSKTEKGLLANQDVILGGLFLLLTLFATYFLYMTGVAYFSGQATADEKKTVYVMLVFIVVGVLLSKHFFTKEPGVGIVDIEYAGVVITKDNVTYRSKIKGYEYTWQEPLKNYNAISVHKETMSTSDLDQNAIGMSDYVDAYVIYLENASNHSRNVSLQISMLKDSAKTIAENYAEKLGITNIIIAYQ